MSKDKSTESYEVSSELLKRAVEFHGHLGPFLVLGLRMSKTAHRFLKQISRVKVKTASKPPRSCVIDGIQIVTRCTIGNTKLAVVESPSEISGEFIGEGEKVVIRCKNKFLKNLDSSIKSKEKTLEEIALNIKELDDNEIFDIEKTKTT
ncbi:MAG: formylmethanofuran dehydrogenase subunit E family protein [Candidatus Jordarchaeaceae archaeon]